MAERRILLMVLGMTPAVVTETLWWLVNRRPEPFVPDEIRLLTTGEAHDRFAGELLGSAGRIQAFAQAHGIALPEPRVDFVLDPAGAKVRDIRAPEESAWLADATVALVAELTARRETAIHASMAGGRKTMSFFLGYVMSLFGRDQDELSHVLVRPDTYEQPGFWWPTDRTPGAEIDVQDVPFVRLRAHFELEELAELRTLGFGAVVAQLRQRLEQRKVVLIDRKRSLSTGGQTIRLAEQSYAMYRLLAEVLQEERRGAGPEGVGSAHRGWLTVAEFRNATDEMVRRFATSYEAIKDPGGGLAGEFLAGLTRPALGLDETADRFQTIRGNLRRQLKEAIRDRAVRQRLLPGVEPGSDGQPDRFGLDLDPADIEIVPGSGGP